MKMNEVLPDLKKALDAADAVSSVKKGQRQAGPEQNRQQGTQHRSHRKTGQQTPGQKQPSNQTTQPNKVLQRGQKITLPTDQGDEQEFKITRNLGNEIEIENPEGNSSPSQPNKLVYNKSDLEKVLRQKK